MHEPITTRYRDRLSGVLSCFDRIIITGTLPGACYAAGMTSFLYMHQIRIFDYTRFAEPLRKRIRTSAMHLLLQQVLRLNMSPRPIFAKKILLQPY